MYDHLLRHNPFLTNTFKGQINVYNKGRGRLRKTYLEKMTRQAGSNRHADMKRIKIGYKQERMKFQICNDKLRFLGEEEESINYQVV